jgi:hypothetical protein
MKLETISINYKFTNSAVKTYQSVVMRHPVKMVANNKFVTKPRGALDSFVD